MVDKLYKQESQRVGKILLHKGLKEGDYVQFRVENQWSGCWSWPLTGYLGINKGEWIIKTDKGLVTINHGYDAYVNSIEVMPCT